METIKVNREFLNTILSKNDDTLEISIYDYYYILGNYIYEKKMEENIENEFFGKMKIEKVEFFKLFLGYYIFNEIQKDEWF